MHLRWSSQFVGQGRRGEGEYKVKAIAGQTANPLPSTMRKIVTFLELLRLGRGSSQEGSEVEPLGSHSGPIFYSVGLVYGLTGMGLIGEILFPQSLKPLHFVSTPSHASSRVKCGKLTMADIHLVSFGNWAQLQRPCGHLTIDGASLEAWEAAWETAFFSDIKCDC